MAFLWSQLTDLKCVLLQETSGRFAMTKKVTNSLTFLANLHSQAWLKSHNFLIFHIKTSCNGIRMLKYTVEPGNSKLVNSKQPGNSKLFLVTFQTIYNINHLLNSKLLAIVNLLLLLKKFTINRFDCTLFILVSYPTLALSYTLNFSCPNRQRLEVHENVKYSRTW